jgi:hypothetical protein
VPRSWCRSALSAVVAGAVLLQGPRYRVSYQVEAVRVHAGTRATIGAGRVSGPLETDLRLALRGDSLEVESLFSLLSQADSATLVGEFRTRRLVSRSRRGLPLWEDDAYRRTARVAWGGVVRIYPLGIPRTGAADSLWLEVAVSRRETGGDTRPTETVTIPAAPLALTIEAVVRPRRARVTLTLARNDSTSAPRDLDLGLGAPARRVRLVLGGGDPPGELDVALVPPADSGRRAVDLVCIRVALPYSVSPIGLMCGRLNNVARRLPLPGGDTLVATFAWPASR